MERIHYKKCTDKKTRTNIRISKQTKKNTKKKKKKIHHKKIPKKISYTRKYYFK